MSPRELAASVRADLAELGNAAAEVAAGLVALSPDELTRLHQAAFLIESEAASADGTEQAPSPLNLPTLHNMAAKTAEAAEVAAGGAGSSCQLGIVSRAAQFAALTIEGMDSRPFMAVLMFGGDSKTHLPGLAGYFDALARAARNASAALSAEVEEC
jgi:hypothetical protein